MDKYTDLEDSLREIDRLLKKDTMRAIHKNEVFFKDLVKEPVDKVYSSLFN